MAEMLPENLDFNGILSQAKQIRVNYMQEG
jgi:hypothetical protein